MVKQRSKPFSKVTAILLALMMAVVFMPTFAFATDGGAAEDITVFMTVSNQGVIAAAKDGSAMAWREVTVQDLDKDGKHSFHEALVAAHAEYSDPDGYAVNTESGWVSSIWGVKDNPAGYSFLQNGDATDLVTTAIINGGDYLTASINQDVELYADWAASFNKPEVTTEAGRDVVLTLTGFPAMSQEDPAPGKDVQIGEWIDGEFVPIEGKKTNAKGKVSVSFNKTGTHIISAQGPVESTWDAGATWTLMETAKDKEDKAVYGRTDWGTFTSYVGYTKNDYGEGPYPWSEIEWIELEDFDADTFDLGHLLYSAEITAESPIIAPCCIVNVGPPDAIYVGVTVNDKGVLATTVDEGAMADKFVVVKDLNLDGEFTYDEAMIAAHVKYCPEGKDGFATDEKGWVTKLWGVETGNTLFYVNNESISPDTVKTKVIEEDDSLYASVNKDDVSWSDWMSYFDDTDIDAALGEPVTVSLNGFLGWDDDSPEPLEDIQIGYWVLGEFVPIEGAVTNEEGIATFIPEEAGEHIVTAKGALSADGKSPIMAPFCYVDVYKNSRTQDMKLYKSASLEALQHFFPLSNYRLKEQVKVSALILKAQGRLLLADSLAEIKVALIEARDALIEIPTDADYKAKEKAVKTAKVENVKAKAGKKKITVTWERNTAFDGYQVSYAIKGGKAKTVTVKKNTTVKKVIKGLKKGKKYTSKVRGYKTIDGKKIYSSWFKAKTVKVK